MTALAVPTCLRPMAGRVSLQDGLNLQRSGRLADAEQVYGAIVAANPDDAMAITLLGSVWCESGRFDAGVALLRQAIKTSDYALSHFLLASSLASHGQMEEAAAAFRRSIELQPSVLAAHIGLGQALAAVGDYSGAADAYRDALRLDPNDPEPYRCTGLLLHQLGRPQDGLAHLQEAAKLGPDRPDVWATLGNAYLALRRYDNAALAFGKEIALGPSSAAAHLHLGDAHHGQGDLASAQACFARAIECDPCLVLAHLHSGTVLYELNRFEDAAAAALAVLAVQPDFADAHSNLGNAYLALGRHDEAEAAFRNAIRLQPGCAAYHSNLGTLLTARRCLPDALDAQRTALAIDPNFVDAHYNHAISLLLDGQWAEGWVHYEARWLLPWNKPRPFVQPRWDGAPLDGRSILLHAEQGLGDMLQMARYVPMVAARGGRVLLEVHEPLVRLFTTVPGVQQVVPLGGALPPFDLHCPMFSLPLVFDTRVDTVPAKPYLLADPAVRIPDHLAEVLRDRPGLRVGLVWAGADQIGATVNRDRSITLEQMARLAAIPGIALYGLQKDIDPHTATVARATGIVDLMRDVVDFADTAALVDQLDIVIGIDTSTIHLAAAMGKRVWLLSRFSGCWRWLADGVDSPWYPSLRIYRQDRPGNWDGVIDRIKRDLAAAT